MFETQLLVLLTLFLALTLVSVLYFFLCRSLPVGTRIAASAHGFLVALVLPYGLLVDALIRGDAPAFLQVPIALLPLLALVSIGYSVRAYPGSRWIHLVHGVTIVLAWPVVFLGSVAIVGWT